MQLDGMGLLQAIRGAVMGVVISHCSVAARPTLVGVHMMLAYASMCALIAGMQACVQSTHSSIHSSWALRLWQCVVCGCLFCVFTAQDAWSALLYVSQLQPWVYVFSRAPAHVHLPVLFASCMLWVELGVLALARTQVPLKARAATSCMLGSLLLSTGLLFVPQYLVGAAVHPGFRVLDTLVAYASYNVRSDTHFGERDVIVLVSQTWCIFYVTLLAFSTLGLLPSQAYTVSVMGWELAVMEVDLITTAYTPLLLPCVFVDVTIARPVWKMTLAALLLMDSMFVPVLMLGPVLCSSFLHMMPSSHAQNSLLPLFLALFSTSVVLFYVTVILDEMYAFLHRSVACRWPAWVSAGGYELQSTCDAEDAGWHGAAA
jgi:hypothetical protein